MQVDHHSLSYLFTFFYLCFIPLFHSTSSDFFLCSSCSMFDLGSASTHYTFLFDMFIHLSSLFVWEPLGPRLMTFPTHCISCMRGMRIISLGSLSLVSFRFLHPITLAYVMSRVLRPPWGHDFAHCTWQLTHGLHLRLVGDHFLEHDGWGAMIWFTLGHTSLISDGFSEVMWSTLGHTPLIDDIFFRDDALHWGIVSLLLHLVYDGLRVVGWPYTGT